MRVITDEPEFSVSVDGLLLLAHTSYDAARAIMDNRTDFPGRFRQIYLTAKGAAETRPAVWRKATLPRRPSLTVSAKERERLAAKIAADREIASEVIE